MTINNRGDVIASCDADGAIKLWDVRTVTEIGTIQVSQHPCNKVAFDRSATRVVCASEGASTWQGRHDRRANGL